MKNIERYYRVIDRSLFTTAGALDYDRLTAAIIQLADAVHEYDGDTGVVWCIGEFNACCLADLLVGAYWHYTEWHGGQWSRGYAALCAIGRVFDPGMAMPERENGAYLALEIMASEENS